MSHAATFLDEVVETARRIEPETVEALCGELVSLRDRDGRLFILGVGGSAGNASHAVNDFRKLCGIEPMLLPTMFRNSAPALTTKAGRRFSRNGSRSAAQMQKTRS